MGVFKQVFAAALAVGLAASGAGAQDAPAFDFKVWLEDTFSGFPTPENAPETTKYVQGKTAEGGHCALFLDESYGSYYVMLGQNFSYIFNSHGSSYLSGGSNSDVALDYNPKNITSENRDYQAHATKTGKSVKLEITESGKIQTYHVDTRRQSMEPYQVNKTIEFFTEKGSVYKIEAEDKLNNRKTTCYFTADIS